MAKLHKIYDFYGENLVQYKNLTSLLERYVEAMSHRGKKRYEEAVNRAGDSNSGSFYEFVPRNDVSHGGKKVRVEEAEKMNSELEKFNNLLPVKTRPFSFLPHVLSLPLDIQYSEDGNALLWSLVTDTGFLFEEVRPGVTNQYSPAAFVAAQKSIPKPVFIGKKKYYFPIIAIRLDEENIIEEALYRLQKMYRCAGESEDQCPDILRRLDRLMNSGETRNEAENLTGFRQLLRSVSGRSTNLKKKVIPQELLEKKFYCSAETGLATNRQALYEPLEYDEHGPVAYTLKDAVQYLVAILEEIESDKREILKKLPDGFSQTGYQRYCEMMERRQILQRVFQETRTYIDLRNEIVEQRLNPDGASQLIPVEFGDATVPSAQHDSCQTDRLKWTDMIERPAVNDKTVQSVCRIFCNYMKLKDCHSEILFRSIEHIVQFSLQEVFRVFEPEVENGITFAPVITYLIFCEYGKQLTKKELKSISIRKVFQKRNPSSVCPEKAEQDLKLYDNLCGVYAEYYCDEHNHLMKAKMAWDIVFLRYSGYWCYFEDMSVIRRRKCSGTWPFQTAEFLPFEWLYNCVEINRITSLTHSAALKVRQDDKILDRFCPTQAGDPGWDAVCKICDQLQTDEKKDNSSWLARYLCAISHSYSDGYMRNFLDDCIMDLYPDEAQEFKTVFYHHLYNYLKLSEGFSSDWMRHSLKESKVLAALEYTLRMILANRCYERLYHWMKAILAREPDKNDNI